MADHHHSQPNQSEPFTQFWTDFFNRMNPGNVGMPSAGPAPSQDAARQMQQMFYDAMAKYFDDYMRSDQFRQMIKESMDRTIAFKQQMDQFLAQLHRGVQSPSREDLDDIGATLRSIEDRLLDRLDDIDERVADLERPRRAGRDAEASAAKRPSRRATASSKQKTKAKSKKKSKKRR